MVVVVVVDDAVVDDAARGPSPARTFLHSVIANSAVTTAHRNTEIQQAACTTRNFPLKSTVQESFSSEMHNI